jgi:SAM-dependent methyltransferase
VSTSFACAVCGNSQLEEIEEYQALPRVTSDCKPFRPGGRLFVCGGCGAIQKVPDKTWRAEIEKIYQDYEVYSLSEGAEQVIFTPSGAVPRSLRLIEFLKSTVNLPPLGRLIDVGCGNGAALSRLSGALPGWRLYGSELSDRALPRLGTIPNFAELFTVQIDKIVGRFDLVSLIHSLEHMPSPRSTLEQATRLLAENGILFVEVPDVETSPFDLVVADHLMHFSRATLGHLAAQAGAETLVISNTVLPKEVTLIGRAGLGKVAQPATPPARPTTGRATVRWLNQVLAYARSLATAKPFGIFGTSISGMWLFGPLNEAVSFFVDEDPSRIGRDFAGRRILSPLDAPPGATVMVPLAPAVAGKIAERYANAPARFVPVPPFDEPGAN